MLEITELLKFFSNVSHEFVCLCQEGEIKISLHETLFTEVLSFMGEALMGFNQQRKDSWNLEI